MTVYSGTVVHLKPKYHLVIVELDDGTRVMGRVDGEYASIGDEVVETESREGIRYFRKA
jgi:uncharacterized OB-fold protein